MTATVKLDRDVTGHKRGETITLSKVEAERWVRSGFARYVSHADAPHLREIGGKRGASGEVPLRNAVHETDSAFTGVPVRAGDPKLGG